MRLEFGELRLDQFKCFIGDHCHTLNLDVDYAGLYFVKGVNKAEPRLGSNGSGKSTLWQALTWILYGRTASGLKNPDVKAWYGKKKTSGSVIVFVDSVEHVIERTASPNKLMIDGNDAGQDAVDRLLSMSFDVFIQTVLMAQGQPLFFDLQPRAKMDLFSDVLELERWESRSAQASSQVSRLNDVMHNVDTDIVSVESAMDEIEDTLQDLKDKSNSWESDRASQIENREKSLKKCVDVIDKLQKQYDTADLTYDSVETDRRLSVKELDKIYDDLKKVDKDYNDCVVEIKSLEAQSQRLQKEYDDLGDAEDCPVCGQSLEGTDLIEHQEELRLEIKRLNKRISNGVPKNIKTKRDKLNSRVDGLEKTIKELQSKSDAIADERDAVYPRLAQAKAEAKELEKLIEENIEQDNPFTDQIKKMRRKNSKLQVEHRELTDEKKLVQEDIEHTKFWVKGFKDIRLYIVEDVLQEMHLVSSAMLDEIGLVGWQINYDIEKESKSGSIQRGINVTIVSPSNKNAVKWESWSGGEGQRLRLVGALALSEVLLNYANVQVGLEILDEPTRHMSSEGIEDTCAFLAERAYQLDKVIFYTDHAAVESRYFVDTITVEKDSKGSRIIQETVNE